jgi:hypothetical protein
MKFHMGQSKIYKFLVVLFWFFLLPFIFAFFLFLHKTEIPVKAIRQDKEGRSKYTISTDELNKPNLKNTVRKIFQSTFDLSYYSLCVTNISQLTNTSTNEIIPLNLTLRLENKDGDSLQEWGMKGEEEKCAPFKITNDTFYYQYKVESLATSSISSIQTASGQCKPLSGATNFDFKAKPLKSDQTALVIIFYIAYWGLAMLLISIWQHGKEYFIPQKLQRQ